MNALEYELLDSGFVKFEEMKEREMLAYADEVVERVKENEDQKARFEEIAAERIKKIKEQLEEQVSKLDNWIEQDKLTLLQIANLSKTKETKTQRKLELLAGDVIIKKATKRFKNDNATILEAIKKDRPYFVKEKVTQSLDWAELKKVLEIQDDGSIVNTVTGEVEKIAGLEVENVPQIVQVK